MVYGELAQGPASDLARCNVQLRYTEPYPASLRKYSPHWEALSSYPVLPKYLSLSELADLPISQLLHLDCDTFFFADVNLLFERYCEHDWYGREEVHSPWSPHSDPVYLDAAALAAIVQSERLRAAPTLNTGAVLLNHGVHAAAGKQCAAVLEYVARFMLWLAQHPRAGENLPFAAPISPDLSALPFPSSNAWIADEVAFWLALGRLPGITASVFAEHDFLQGQEFLATSRAATKAVAAHYFSANQQEFVEWLGDDLD